MQHGHTDACTITHPLCHVFHHVFPLFSGTGRDSGNEWKTSSKTLQLNEPKISIIKPGKNIKFFFKH